MKSECPTIKESELVSKDFILEKIEDWKSSNTYKGILVVVDQNNRLKGVLTDGFLRQLSRRDSRKEIKANYPKDPIVLKNNQLFKFKAKTLVRIGRDFSENILYVPEIDSNNSVICLCEINYYLEKSITILGLGYVGVTLAAHILSRNFSVIGVDPNKFLIKNLKKARMHVSEKGLDDIIASGIRKKNFILYENPLPSGTYVVAVGSPVDKKHKPSYDSLLKCCKDISLVMNKGSLIVFRSTVGLGVTRKLLIPELEKLTDMVAGKDFHVAFCPERTAEGVALKELAELPQLISGYSKQCLLRAAKFWRNFSATIVECSSIEVAELAKLSNNTFRDITFAFSNELADACHSINIDANEVIRCANQGYVRNTIAFPSVGVGGYCLTKDPYIFAHSTNRGQMSIAELGRIKNIKSLDFPLTALKKWEKINKENIPSKILIVGVAFKGNPATSDIRMSPSISVIEKISLRHPHAKIYFTDSEFKEKKLTVFEEKTVSRYNGKPKKFDVVMILNNHVVNQDIDLSLLREGGLFFDGYKQFSESSVPKNLIYATIGKTRIS